MIKKSRYPYPKFVRDSTGRVLRLVCKGGHYEYYCDRGDWFIEFEERSGMLYTKEHDFMPNMGNDELLETTMDGWKESNKGYTPKSTKVELPKHLW